MPTDAGSALLHRRRVLAAETKKDLVMTNEQMDLCSFPSEPDQTSEEEKLELVRISLAAGLGLRDAFRYIKGVMFSKDQHVTRVRIRLDLLNKSGARN